MPPYRSYKGSQGRLWAMYARLLRGETVRVVALGGSITRGFGMSYERGEQTYVSHYCSWLRRAFAPFGGGVQCVNAAVPGVQSEYVSVCLQ